MPPPLLSRGMVQVVSADGHIDRAVAELASGRPVVMPTETVYGLAVSTFDVSAIRRVYELKGRPQNNPLIAHVGSVADVWPLIDGTHPLVEPLAEACWPGPLTLVLPAAPTVPLEAIGGRATIAVRVPNHPIAQALLAAFPGPLSAPSANRSGLVSPTTAEHVAHDYIDITGAEDLLVLDGGPCDAGIESTVLDLTCDPPRILRLGSVSSTTISEVVGPIAEIAVPNQQANAPGTAQRHYAPRIPVQVHSPTSLKHALSDAIDLVVVIGPTDLCVAAPHLHLQIPDDVTLASQTLYRLIRQADQLGADRLAIVLPPPETKWAAIRDRLVRASAPPMQ